LAISLAFIIVLGLCAGYLFRRLKLHGLVGMLLVGIAVGPYALNLLQPEMMAISADFRKIALIVILSGPASPAPRYPEPYRPPRPAHGLCAGFL
jgi:NhaP-type Na+/H+ or K+/H+ antiporter